MDRESSVSLTDPPLANKFNSTVSPVKTKQAQLPANEGEHFSECISENSRKESVGSISRLLSYFQWWKSTCGFLKNFHVYHWMLSPNMLRSFPWQAVQWYRLNLEAQPPALLGAKIICGWGTPNDSKVSFSFLGPIQKRFVVTVKPHEESGPPVQLEAANWSLSASSTRSIPQPLQEAWKSGEKLWGQACRWVQGSARGVRDQVDKGLSVPLFFPLQQRYISLGYCWGCSIGNEGTKLPVRKTSLKD